MSQPLSREKLGHAFLLGAIVFGAIAHLLLKYATMIGSHLHSGFPSLWLLGGLGIYACGTVCWILCLRYLDLSYAYPFNALLFLLVLFGSWFLFEDKISGQRLAGAVIVCVGVILIPLKIRSDT